MSEFPTCTMALHRAQGETGSLPWRASSSFSTAGGKLRPVPRSLGRPPDAAFARCCLYFVALVASCAPVQDGVVVATHEEETVSTPLAAAPRYDVFWTSRHLGAHNLLNPSNALPASAYPCNNPSFTQVPGASNELLGRDRLTPPGGDVCSEAPHWNLVRAVINPTTHAVTKVGSILTPPARLSTGETITDAYDPSAMLYNGEIWVAFECWGLGFVGTGSACIGPYSSQGGVDVSRTSIVVQGTSYTSSAFEFSASVPKLLVHQNVAFLYWSAVKIQKATATSAAQWVEITTRGAELSQEPGGLRRLLPKRIDGGEVRTIASNDPSFSYEVWSVDPSDRRSNTVADAFQMVSDGTYVYATAGLGGDAGGVRCLGPTSNSPGCYRLAIARSRVPLGTNIFKDRVPEGDLPSNPQEYSRLFIRADGGLTLMGNFFALPPSAPRGANDLRPGFLAFDLPIPPPTCDAVAQPSPSWGVKGGVCLPSCGARGGTSALVDPCANQGLADTGPTYDAPFCCKRVLHSALLTGDYDGDGRADVVFSNRDTGQIYQYILDGLVVRSQRAVYAEPNLAWHARLSGDLDADGKDDIVWHNQVTGQVYAMLMNGSAITNQREIYREPNLAWRLVAMADFNGDRKDDLLWHNSQTGQVHMMLMNGMTLSAAREVYAEPNLAWVVAAAADFDGDGKADLLWRNTKTGQVYLMLLNGMTITAERQIYADANLAWNIAAAADFDGDGKADIAWHNGATGQVYLMLLSGMNIRDARQIYQEPNVAWRIAAAADFNGDRRADLLWFNSSTGQLYETQLNGFSIIGVGPIN